MDNKLYKNASSKSALSIEDDGCALLVNTNHLNSQGDDIVLPDSVDLDFAQITYAINCKRLLFINNYKTWFNFYTENGDKYTDYTPEELSHRFIKRVLPYIYEYELTDDELYLLNVLDLHPHFTRTDNGFIIKEQIEKLNFPKNESAIETILKDGNLSQKNNLIEEDLRSDYQIFISGTEDQSSSYEKFNFNAENAALLSVVFCSDDDLPNCELLTTDKLRNRLKAAKKRFENNGQLLEEVDLSLDNILKKLKTLQELKVAVAELVDKSFREQMV